MDITKRVQKIRKGVNLYIFRNQNEVASDLLILKNY